MGSITRRLKSVVLPIAVLGLLQLGAVPVVGDELLVIDEIDVSFELIDQNGNITGIKDFEGKNVLLAFGFTSCAHICPMMAANMARSIKATDKSAVGIFISVDTERDSPEVTGAYASRFSDSMIGLSGSYAQIAAAANNFKVSFVVTKTQESYTVQHTQDIFLIGPDGTLIDTFALNTPADRIAAAMR